MVSIWIILVCRETLYKVSPGAMSTEDMPLKSSSQELRYIFCRGQSERLNDARVKRNSARLGGKGCSSRAFFGAEHSLVRLLLNESIPKQRIRNRISGGIESFYSFESGRALPSSRPALVALTHWLGEWDGWRVA